MKRSRNVRPAAAEHARGDRAPRLDAATAVRELESALAAAGDPDRAVQEKRYLKSELEHLGASVPGIRKVAARFLELHPDLRRTEVLAVVEELWRRPVHDCRAAAVELLDAGNALLDARDLALVERLIRESRTWALVDVLAASVAGSIIERHPEAADILDRWAVDPDFWVRRSALLALLLPLRRGEGDFARFGSYTDRMLEEREFFIRKAIGWVLREMGRKRPVTRPPVAASPGGTRRRTHRAGGGETSARSAAQRDPGRPRSPLTWPGRHA